MSSPAPVAVTLDVLDYLCSYYDRLWARGGVVDPVDELSTFASLSHSPQVMPELAARLAARAHLSDHALMRTVSAVKVDNPTQLGIAYAVCAYALGVADPVDEDIVAGLTSADIHMLTGASAGFEALLLTAHSALGGDYPPGSWLRSLSLEDPRAT